MSSRWEGSFLGQSTVLQGHGACVLTSTAVDHSHWSQALLSSLLTQTVHSSPGFDKIYVVDDQSQRRAHPKIHFIRSWNELRTSFTPPAAVFLPHLSDWLLDESLDTIHATLAPFITQFCTTNTLLIAVIDMTLHTAAVRTSITSLFHTRKSFKPTTRCPTCPTLISVRRTR